MAKDDYLVYGKDGFYLVRNPLTGDFITALDYKKKGLGWINLIKGE